MNHSMDAGQSLHPSRVLPALPAPCSVPLSHIYRAASLCPALCQALGIEEGPELLTVWEGDNWQLHALTEDVTCHRAQGGPMLLGRRVLGPSGASRCSCLWSCVLEMAVSAKPLGQQGVCRAESWGAWAGQPGAFWGR